MRAAEVKKRGKMIFYAKTHKGKIRSKNEDCIYVPKENDGFFAVVADGMGGHNAGEVASKIVVDTIVEALSVLTPAEITQEVLKKAISLANKNVWEESADNPQVSGMGSTATAAVFNKDSVMIGHVGDSRAYLFCDGALLQITKDHSYVQLLIDNGNISAEVALFHPQRNIITKAIGTQEKVEADVFTLVFKKNDCVMLCSDGLNATVPDDTIAKILTDGIPLAADNLVEAALEGGGIDNISVIIAQRGGESI